MNARLALLLSLALAPAARAADDGGDSAPAIEAATPPQVREVSERVAKDVERREQRRRQLAVPTSARLEETPDERTIGAVIEKLPGGPPYLDDLRKEAAEEKAQAVEQNIWKTAQERAAPTIRELVMAYLRETYFHGNASTDMGPFIKKMLENADGWQTMPYTHYGPLPDNIAGLYSGGDITIDPVKGNNATTLSHELYHHLGHPDQGPDGAYALMGREFGGGGLGDGNGSVAGGFNDYSFQCS
jgi:hypothetical protein